MTLKGFQVTLFGAEFAAGAALVAEVWFLLSAAAGSRDPVTAPDGSRGLAVLGYPAVFNHAGPGGAWCPDGRRLCLRRVSAYVWTGLRAMFVRGVRGTGRYGRLLMSW
ncbi:hypothetical protein ADL02_01930 [Streptomyces sp. NRRL WC-3723]|nr:hypothetical protein ADL02_01930 [Streptomyces sp. NRRL WC-3723]